MTRRKVKPASDTNGDTSPVATSTANGQYDRSKSPLSTPAACNVASSSKPKQAKSPSPSAGLGSTSSAQPQLLICRNKHWRYISSYNGQWLSLPPEVLTSLATANYYSPRPQPIDPAVFFDLVKIRRLIDEATSLGVRAANGTTASSLSGERSLLNSYEADILGLGGTGRGPRENGQAKLSKERRHRMREHATRMMSEAYKRDEIATSVLTMGGTSALEDVAKHVLQKQVQEGADPDVDASYVHFFHEKIPSRELEQAPGLDTLEKVIRARPYEAWAYRTRAIVKGLTEDWMGAVRDATEGLAVYKLYYTKHENEKRELILARDAVKFEKEQEKGREVDERDWPSSLGPQLHFTRGNACLAMACEWIIPALYADSVDKEHVPAANGNVAHPTAPEREIEETKAEARKMVRTYAKRALRDYLAFLSHIDYTPGLSAEFTEAFLQNVSASSRGQGTRSSNHALLDIDPHSHPGLSEALVKYETRGHQRGQPVPQLPKQRIHRVDALFAAKPPVDLPPYPLDARNPDHQPHPLFNLPDFSEAVTYHPLLSEALHCILLCHCLVQTSSKEHLRHAHMAARVARVCDGQPILQPARSSARADWTEILRRSGNWLGMEISWDKLCQPPQLPERQHKGRPQKEESDDEKSERIRKLAIEGALADERVVDEESFKVSMKAREKILVQDESTERVNRIPGADDVRTTTSCAPDTNKEYSIATRRAEAIVSWIREAPPPSSTDGGTGKKKRSGVKGRSGKMASQTSSVNGDAVSGLEKSVESLDVLD